jgi:hypothetical protein
MPFHQWVDIFEPKQRALIAWDGYEEILILSTDLYASEATQVLEIMPLPSVPAVTAKDIGLFHRLNMLINDLLSIERHLPERDRGLANPVDNGINRACLPCALPCAVISWCCCYTACSAWL